ncbi:MAG: Hsp20/alpha crystallin family protein [Acidimicrobiales bacterium]|nr:Hsp20/alpha crystallin family protein [Acidimicrobiales bacterium]
MLMRFDPFQDFPRPVTGTRRQPVSMPMDAYRDGEEVHIWIDVPGVREVDLDVTVEKSALTVTAERSWEPSESMQVLASERPQGKFSRTFQLGDNLDTEGMQADYDDGVLHLTVPVADKAKPRKVQIGRKALAG